MDIDRCIKIMDLPENATADEIKNSYDKHIDIIKKIFRIGVLFSLSA